jgi:hypothetical protein
MFFSSLLKREGTQIIMMVMMGYEFYYLIYLDFSDEKLRMRKKGKQHRLS